MNSILNGRRCVMYLMLPGFFLTSCNSPKQKAIPVKYIIEIKEMRFQPATLTVQAGDTVEWINKDFVDHDITEENKREWSSLLLATGKSWSLVVTKSANYYCSIHQVMKGKLLVQ
jgi:plastocyanin